VPTPDHYLPLLYIAGAHDPADTVSFPITGFDGGSVSMLSVLVG
jgi:4,5-DOPA dioxygenase extradiol